jgi:hypothetical protein
MILFEQTTEKSFVFLGLPALFVCSSEAATSEAGSQMMLICFPPSSVMVGFANDLPTASRMLPI